MEKSARTVDADTQVMLLAAIVCPALVRPTVIGVLRKAEPVMLTPVRVCPSAPVVGLMPASTGGGYWTSKASARVAWLASSLVTVTSQEPVAAPVMSRSQVIRAGETTVTEVASRSVCPVLCSLTVAPERKLEPERSEMCAGASLLANAGVMPVTVGPWNWIVKAPASVSLFPSEFVTRTSQAPVAAPVMSTSQVILFAETTETEVARMSVCPDFLSLTVAPERKPAPARLVMWTTPSLLPVSGAIESTWGGG